VTIGGENREDGETSLDYSGGNISLKEIQKVSFI